MNIDKLAQLAQLEFDDATKIKMMADLENILGFVNELSKIDTTGIEPLVYMNEDHSQTRPDIVQNELSQAEALRNAPQQNGSYFEVPKVIDNS